MVNKASVKNTSNEDKTQDNSHVIDESYTRVTSVLYPFSGLSSVNPDVLANAARRGTRVHNICESIVRGMGAWDVDDEVIGYVRSFEDWWNQGHKVLAVEKRFYCDEFMITGQVDLIIEKDEGSVILDLKTSSRPSKTWALQGSAYAHMARQYGYDIKGIQFLHLKKNGSKPKVYEYEDHFDLYKKCLDAYRYFWGPNRKAKK